MRVSVEGVGESSCKALYGSDRGRWRCSVVEVDVFKRGRRGEEWGEGSALISLKVV